MRHVYYAMCARTDWLFGQTVEGLKKTGYYDNSAVFYLTDHGDYTGDFEMAEKAQNLFEDCLTKVPFIVKPPKGEGCQPGVRDQLMELVDLSATIYDFANLTH